MARYAEQQTQTNVSRLRRGTPFSFLPSVPSVDPDFTTRLRRLLPPERRLTRLDRTLTGRAAEILVRQRTIDAESQGMGSSWDCRVGVGEIPTAEDDIVDATPTGGTGLQSSAVSKLLGLSQRTFGAPLDVSLEVALEFLGQDTLQASPLRPATPYLLRRATSAYKRLAA